MISILKIFNLLLMLFLNYCFITVLVKQYYSYKRFLFIFLKKYFLYLFIIIDALLIFISNDYLKVGISIFSILSLIFIFRPLKIKITRRNSFLIVLSSFSLIINFILINEVLYYKTLLLFINLIFSHMILLPLEMMIRNYYLTKAKNKIKRANMRVIGVTGSFGKTSFKNYLKTILNTKFKVIAPEGNINTLMGICKFINATELNGDILLLEIGIDSLNSMEKFKKLVSLDYAIITSVGEMHLATFKNIKNIRHEKLKIASLLNKDGILFVNEDNCYLKDIDKEKVIKFSENNLDFVSFNIEGIKFKYEDKIYKFNVHQSFFKSYLDGVIKVCKHFDILEKSIYNSSFLFFDSEKRNQVFKTSYGYLIDNSYNSNLVGIEESLNLINSLKGETYIITSGLIEQGKKFNSSNCKLKNKLKNMNVIFVGEKNHPLIHKHEFKKLIIIKTINDAYKIIRDIKPNNILLLSKGDDIYLR